MTLNLSERTVQTILHALAVLHYHASEDAKAARKRGRDRLADDYQAQAADAAEASAIVTECIQ